MFHMCVNPQTEAAHFLGKKKEKNIGCQRMVHQKQTRQVEGKFDMEIVSQIVQQLHAGVISLLPFAPI